METKDNSLEYNYIQEMVEISKKTTKENSILYSIEIEDKAVIAKISIINQLGDKQEVKKSVFSKNQDFFNTLIIPMIKKFTEINKVVFNDIVDMNKDNKTTYRLLTENNDLLTVDGLTFQDTSYLQDFIEELKRNTTADTSGKVDVILLFTFIILLSGIVFAYCLF